MPNTANPAADIGLPYANVPDVSRRRLLIGLAAASAAAAGVAPMGATALVPAENPELFRLVAEAEAALDACILARQERDARYETWEAHLPAPPDELTAVYRGGKRLQHIDGGDRLFGNRYIVVPTLDSLEMRQREARRHLDFKSIREGKRHGGNDRAGWEAEIERIEALKPVAARFHDETERVMAASGYSEVAAQANKAFIDLWGALDRIVTAEAVTMAGVVVKCQVIDNVRRRAGRDMSFRTDNFEPYHAQLAAEILRIAAAHGEA